MFRISQMLAMARAALSTVFGPNILDLFNLVRQRDYMCVQFCLVNQSFVIICIFCGHAKYNVFSGNKVVDISILPQHHWFTNRGLTQKLDLHGGQ